jgi:hypothetical protein
MHIGLGIHLSKNTGLAQMLSSRYAKSSHQLVVQFGIFVGAQSPAPEGHVPCNLRANRAT